MTPLSLSPARRGSYMMAKTPSLCVLTPFPAATVCLPLFVALTLHICYMRTSQTFPVRAGELSKTFSNRHVRHTEELGCQKLLWFLAVDEVSTREGSYRLHNAKAALSSAIANSPSLTPVCLFCLGLFWNSQQEQPIICFFATYIQKVI